MTYPRLFFIAYNMMILNIGLFLGEFSVNPIEKGLLLVAAVTLVWTRPKNYVVLICLAAMVFITFTSGMFTRSEDFKWATYFLSLNQIVVPMLFMASRPTLDDRAGILKVAAWTPVLSALLGVVYAAAGIHQYILITYGTHIERFQGSIIPAFFGGFAMVGAAAAVIYADVAKDRRYLWLAVVNLLLLIASGARVPVVVGFVVCVTTFAVRFKGAIRLKLIVLLGSFFAGAVIYYTVGAGLVDRFSEQSLSGRDIMWNYLDGVLDRYGDFGVGFGQQMSNVPREIYIQTGSQAAHNDFLRSAIEIGYYQSFMFYGLFIGSMLFQWARVYRCDPVFLTGIAGFFLLSATDNALASASHFPLLFVTAYGAIRNDGALTARVLRQQSRRSIYEAV